MPSAIGFANAEVNLEAAKMRAGEAEHERELIAQLRQCPKCGATDYDQR